VVAVPPLVTGPKAPVGAEGGVEDVVGAGVELVKAVDAARTVADEKSTPRRRISFARTKMAAFDRGERA
jgi:hypothetical protein